MSEKKTRKLIEFKIVRSPLKEIPEITASHSSQVQKNKNSESSKKKKISPKLNSEEGNQNTLNSNFLTPINSVKNSNKKEKELTVSRFNESNSTDCGSDLNKKHLNKKRRRNADDNKICSDIFDFDDFLVSYQKATTKQEEVATDKLHMKIEINRKAKPKKENLHKTINPTKRKKRVKTKINISRSSCVYDIDNFVIQNNAIKIHQKHERLDIPIPIFKEVELDTKEDEDEVKIY
jgi:hypothetical protein